MKNTSLCKLTWISALLTILAGILLAIFAVPSQASDSMQAEIQPKDIPEYIANYKEQHDKLALVYLGEHYQLNLVNIVEDGLLVSFDKGVALLGFDFRTQQPASQLTIYEGKFNLSHLSKEHLKQANQVWHSNDISISDDDEQITYQGRVENKHGQQTQVNALINESLISGGASHITVKENKAILTGGLGTSTYIQIKNLIQDSPQVDTLVIAKVKGSLNDEINVHTGYLVRQAGLNTEIPKNGYAYSGGVDLLLSGVKRKVANTAKVGVHSWCCVDDKTAAELPQHHPAHQSLVDYSSAMLGSKKGKAFYFYTLEAAPFDGVHIMTPDEMKMFDVVTH